MSTGHTDKNFTGSIPRAYEEHLVPLIFQYYADDLAARVVDRAPVRVLEIACGTGVVTRALAARLPPGTAIVATDLNQAMLDHAAGLASTRPVEWRQADAQQLPFADESFDAVVCQFGVMFVPDKPKAMSEVHRVLSPGGAFLFNVWDGLAHNDCAAMVERAMEAVFPADVPRFLSRTPYGYNDVPTIERHLRAGGFNRRPELVTLTARSRAASASAPAIGFCLGTPLRLDIQSKDQTRLDEATRAATDAVAAACGNGPIDAKMQAIVVTVEK